MRSSLRRLVMGLGVAGLFFLVLELALAGGSAVLGVELRQRDPLARDVSAPVLCPVAGSGGLRLCANAGDFFQKVRSRTFTQVPARARVVVVGESFVYGLGYPAELTWPGRLEHHLGPGVEVLNFGRCGSESTGLMPTVRAALELEPDVLVLAIGNNEYTMTPFYSGWLGRDPGRAHRLLRLLGRVHVYGLLQRIFGARLPSAAAREIRELGAHPHRAAIEAVHQGGRGPSNAAFPMSVVDREPSELFRGSKQVAELLHAERLGVMVDWAEERGVAVVLATLPRDHRTRPRLSGSFGMEGDTLRGLLAELAPLARFRDGDPGGERGPAQVTWATAADAAARRAPRAAHVRWHQGAARWMGGDRAGALAAWTEAWQADLSPDSTPAINDNIRRLALAGGHPLVGLDRLAEAWMEQEGSYWDHPPGDGELAGRHDPIHVGPDGADAVAQAVAEVVGPLLARERSP